METVPATDETPHAGSRAVKYEVPANWIRYDPMLVFNNLVEAKSAALSLKASQKYLKF
jgi:hypothetical protein